MEEKQWIRWRSDKKGSDLVWKAEGVMFALGSEGSVKGSGRRGGRICQGGRSMGGAFEEVALCG